MKSLFGALALLLSVSAMAECEEAKLNETDKITWGYKCKVVDLSDVDHMDEVCLIKAETTDDDEANTYTTSKTWASTDEGWKQYFSTFKWDHRRNDSVSKMYENKKRLKMRDISAIDMFTKNLYKEMVFNKKDETMEIKVWSRGILSPVRDYWYKASLECEKLEL